MVDALSECVFYIARPGATKDNYVEVNDKSRWSSADETSLSPDGQKIIETFAKQIFKDIDFDIAFCSNAQRTHDTAQTILAERNVKIVPLKELYEMRIGETASKTPKEIVEYFKKEINFPHISPEKFPNLCAKRNFIFKDGEVVRGDEIQANDIHLDNWNPKEIDTFNDFSAQFIPWFKELAVNNMGKKVLVVPHGTPMKAIIAEAINHHLGENEKPMTADRVLCEKGSCYVVTVDVNGVFTLKEDMRHGIAFEN